MWLRKMSLGVRSMMCFGIFAFLIVCLGCFALIQTNSLNQAIERIGSRVAPSTKALAALDKRFVELRSEHIRLRNPIESDTRKKQALDEIRSARESISAQLVKLHGLMASDVANTALNKVQDSIVTMFRVEEDYLDKLTRLDGEDGNVVDAREALRTASSKLSTDFSALIDVNESIVAETQERANEIFGQTTSLVSAAMVLALVTMVLLAWLYSRSLLLPISEALRIAQRIASNDFSESISVRGADEPAHLLSALATMQLSLRDALCQIGGSAKQLSVTSEELNAVTSDAARDLL
jgi:methyl-accepting chemotaxis protein